MAEHEHHLSVHPTTVAGAADHVTINPANRDLTVLEIINRAESTSSDNTLWATWTEDGTEPDAPVAGDPGTKAIPAGAVKRLTFADAGSAVVRLVSGGGSVPYSVEVAD